MSENMLLQPMWLDTTFAKEVKAEHSMNVTVGMNITIRLPHYQEGSDLIWDIVDHWTKVAYFILGRS